MKKVYEAPEMKMEELEVEDVITTSNEEPENQGGQAGGSVGGDGGMEW